MITLNHTIEEINIILKHLANGAYAEVAGVIEKLKAQATPQVEAIQQAQATPPTTETPPQA
jgi:hypothetical protein